MQLAVLQLWNFSNNFMQVEPEQLPALRARRVHPVVGFLSALLCP